MGQNGVQSGEFLFSIDSNLLLELGEQLVTKPSIALAELIKNAYDADSTKVTVILDKVDQPNGTILIEDNGHGMTFEEIENSWMRIATFRKREKPISRIYSRPLTGAKGIGRLAVQRLGTKLMLSSIAERNDEGIVSKERVVVNFDWREQFSPGQNLANIPISYSRELVSLDTKTGVALLVEGVRNIWTRKDIESLRQDLLSVQNPYPDLLTKIIDRREKENYKEADPSFNIELLIDGSDELKDLAGGLGDAFLSAAWAKLEGQIDKHGNAHYEIVVQRTAEQDKLVDTTNVYADLEGASFRIYFFVYKKDFLQDYGLNVHNASRKGRNEGGVRIYLDGFRVFPYGDPGDDWLRLDEYNAKNLDLGKDIFPAIEVKNLMSGLDRPYLNIPKNNQLFGVVLLSQVGHTGIEMNVTRDRLIQTPAFDDLQRFVQNGIYWMTIKYSAFLVNEKLQERERQKKEDQFERKKDVNQTVLDIIEDVKAIVANQAEIPQERRFALLENLNTASAHVKIREEEHISDISVLRILASAGTTLILMNHQLQAIVGAVLQVQQDLQRLRPAIPQNLYKQYDPIIEQVSNWHTMVESQVSMLGFLLSPDSRQVRRRHLLYHIVEEVRKPMSLYMKDYHISFENAVPQTLRTPPIYKAELYAIFINILSNALKAVHSQTTRRISVGAQKADNTLCFWMMDTGIGLPRERRERVFKPFETTSLPDPVLGVGTGLGLMVVKDLLEIYGGSAQFVDVEDPWKTRIEIVLPERGAKSDN